ncbi:MAG: hypothetical protein ACOC71_00065 [Hyphomicrobiales bacterium]
MAAPDIPLICYDFTEVSRFFRSVATIIVLQRNTLLEWTTYRGSSVLNGIYSALFWKTAPGTVEMRTSNRLAMEEEIDKLHERFVLAWLRKLHEGGPDAGNAYVSHMAEVRQAARDALDDVLHDAARINADVAGETRDAIVTLARIRLAAGVGVAVIGAAAGIAIVGGAAASSAAAAGSGAAATGGVTVFGLQAGASGAAFGFAGVGISVTNTIVKSWEEGPTALLAAVSMDAGKAVVSERGGTVAQSAVDKALTQQARSQQIIRSAEGMIRQHSARLARDDLRKGSLRKSRNIVERSTQQVARESDALARAGNLAKHASAVAKGIPVVFAAMDIIGALGDYRQVMSTQQESP